MNVLVTEELQSSAGVVWEMVRGFGEIMKWSGDAIESVSVEGDGVGAVRTIGIAGGAQLQEKLEAHDDAKRTFSYSFVGELLLPVEDYFATMTIIETGANQCRVEWGSTFTPNGVSEEQASGMIEGIYKNGIAGLRNALSG